MLRQMALTEMTPPPTTTPLARNVGARLRTLRLARDETLVDVANGIGTTPQTVQRHETAGMTLSMEWLEKYCGHYGVEPVTLFETDPAAALLADRRRQLRGRVRVLKAASTTFLEELREFLEATEGE